MFRLMVFTFDKAGGTMYFILKQKLLLAEGTFYRRLVWKHRLRSR
jgi:hypothetical protein